MAIIFGIIGAIIFWAWIHRTINETQERQIWTEDMKRQYWEAQNAKTQRAKSDWLVGKEKFEAEQNKRMIF